MGYQDGTGLRAGRTRNKMATTSPATGYRAAGAVSAPAAPPAPAASPAVARGAPQASMPGMGGGSDMGGLGASVLGTVGTKLAGELAGKAGDYLTNAFRGDPIYDMATANDWYSADLPTYEGDVLDQAGLGGDAYQTLAPEGWADAGSAAASGGEGCFITEATMAGLGVADDNAPPLQALRFFRDQVLAGTPVGQALIAEYEAVAPYVVAAVEQRPDAPQIFQQLYQQFIAPAVQAVQGGDYPQALQIYAAMIAAVIPFAQEALDAEDFGEGEMEMASEPMEQMGDDAMQMAQDPQAAQVAAPAPGGGALQQFATDDYPTPVRFGRG